jgi:hypothetical protein
LNRYVYDDEKTETKKTTTASQPSLSSPSVEYYRNVYGAGATKKEEPKKEAAKVADRYSVFETAFNSLKQIVEGAKPVENTVADEIKE